MRVWSRERPPTPQPKPARVFRALELGAFASTTPEAAKRLAGELQGAGLLSTDLDHACARFRELLRDRDGDGKLELDLADPALAGVIDLPSLVGQRPGASFDLETTVDIAALEATHPITISKRDDQDVLSGFLPIVLDRETGKLRAFDGSLGPSDSLIEKVHFAVSDQNITLRVVECMEPGTESPIPKVLFRFPDAFENYKQDGPFASPKARLSLADATTLLGQLSAGVDVSESARLTEAFELLQKANRSGAFASSAPTPLIEDVLGRVFVATPTKAWLGRQTLDLISMPGSATLLDQVNGLSTAVSPQLVLSTMLAEGFNIHWARNASWRGLPEEGPVFGMYHLGLDLIGRTEALAARWETPANRDMNIDPPPPPKGPPTLDYPTAPTFENLVALGLLPADFSLEVLDAKNLVEGQGDRLVYDVVFPSVSDAITAVHATLAFCRERFLRDFDHRYGAGAHEKLTERELSFALSAYYNGGWMYGRSVALRELAPERRSGLGRENVDRSDNLSIRTNAMVRVALVELLHEVRAFPR